MLTTIRLFLCLALLSSTLISHSLANQTEQNQSSAFDYQQAELVAAYQQYLKVSHEEKGNAKKIHARFSKLQQQANPDPLIAVLIASSQTLIGRDALFPWSKLKQTELGLQQLEQAQRLLQTQHDQHRFEQLPISIHVQAIAAITFSQVPDFFGRMEQGYIMFEKMIDSAVFKNLEDKQKTFIFYYAIDAAYKMQSVQQAKLWQQQLKQLNINDDFSQAAAKLGA